MKRLVITADDFGAAREVNDAVEEAHRRGVLTAASLMVAAPATADAVARAKTMPNLRVGLHLVLVDGRPMLPATEIPDLVDEAGNFRNDMVSAGAAIFFRRNVRRQLAAEIAAQFDAFRQTGLTLDHVNTHKHFHLHPTIANMILKIGRARGMRAIRVPIEPRPVLRAAEPGSTSDRPYVSGPWAHLLRLRLRGEGLCLPDAVFGLAWSGAMTTTRLRGLIANLPDGLSEIYLHPATAGGFAGSDRNYRYTDELAALTDPQVARAVRDCGAQRGGFADFPPTLAAPVLARWCESA